MSATFDFDRALESALDATGPTIAPAAVVNTALAQALGVDQRRPVLAALDRRAWPARRPWLGRPATTFPVSRRVAIIALGALLILGLLGALGAGGFLDRPAPSPLRPLTIIVQEWNGLRDPDQSVIQTAFAPGSVAGTPAMEALPANAVGLRWSADGSQLAYWERDAPPDQRSLVLRGLYLARADGTAPVRVALPRSLDQYVSNGWWSGVRWAPTGGHFALAWNTYGCSDGPDCIPPGGIDVFDATGQVIAQIDLSDNADGEVHWSPDGLAVGWTTGSCPDGFCETDAFHRRLVSDAASLTSLPLDRGSSVSWSDADRLLVVVTPYERTGTGEEVTVTTTVGRVYSMAPDGSDIREAPWTPRGDGLVPVWSPDGRQLATLDTATGKLTIHDMVSETDTWRVLPAGLDIGAWAPDSGRLVLYGASDANPQAYALSVIAADVAGFASLGDGDDFAWMPEPPAAGR